MNQKNMTEEYAFSIKTVAELLQTNEETVRRWIREGKLEAQIASRKQGYAITESSLKRFLKATPKYATGTMIAALSLMPLGATLPLVSAALGAFTAAKISENKVPELPGTDAKKLFDSIEHQYEIITQEQNKIIDLCESFEEQLNELQNQISELKQRLQHYSSGVLELQSVLERLKAEDETKHSEEDLQIKTQSEGDDNQEEK